MKHENNRFKDNEMIMILESISLLENELQRVYYSVELTDYTKDREINDLTTRLIGLRTAAVEAIKAQYAKSRSRHLKRVV